MKIQVHTTVMALAFASLAHAQQAVQWRPEDGGNGHWYLLTSSSAPWPAARAAAIAAGGDLAALESHEERLWCRARFAGEFLLGGFQQQPAPSPGERWMWVTGSPMVGNFICDDSPCNCCPGEDGDQDYAHFFANKGTAFGDIGLPRPACPDQMRALFEWSADCNADGIVDYGQLLRGQLPDANSNGVPDSCECAADPSLPACCRGDLTGDRVVDGSDLGVLVNAWGACPVACVSDLNADGFVNGLDLGLLLGNWGACP